MENWLNELSLQIDSIYIYSIDAAKDIWSVFYTSSPLAQIVIVGLPLLFFIMMKYDSHDDNE